MERKIGEIFEYNGEWYQCLKSPDENCTHCDMDFGRKCPNIKECTGTYRIDKKNAIFKKLEKVGEPYRRWLSPSNNIMVQRYRLYDRNVIMPNEPCMYFNAFYYTIEIEIKQNKEDMEGKKIQHYDCFFDEKSSKSKLKPFDLKAAKAGKPVCTRDGAKARIICFDAKSDAPIIALITTDDGTEIAFDYLSDGTFFNSENPDNDLMMLPEKKEGWVNVYKDSVYDTKDEALNRISKYRGYIDTVKINWEE